MTDVAAPRSVNYTDTLPLAIASTQNRRSFYPQNGQAFTDTGSNIIRIDVNADGLLDTQQSYLEFTLNNPTAQVRVLDQGHAWIKRLTIESGTTRRIVQTEFGDIHCRVKREFHYRHRCCEPPWYI